MLPIIPFGSPRVVLDFSLRIRGAANAGLNWTPGATGSRRRFGYCVRFKPAALGTQRALFSAGADANRTMVQLGAGNQLEQHDSGGVRMVSNAVFRDSTAFYELLWAVDTDQASAGARNRFWVNGVEIVSWASNSAMSLGFDVPHVNVAGTVHAIGYDTSGGPGTRQFDGTIAEPIFVTDRQPSPGEFSALVGSVAVPKRFIGAFGANGSRLEFRDASAATAAALGKDSSGNANNWTPVNISVASGTSFDRMTDTPANNHFALNPLDPVSGAAFSAANLAYTNAGSNLSAFAPPLPTTGKWYWEVTLTTLAGGSNPLIGLARANYDQSNTGFLAYRASGVRRDQDANESAYGAGWGVGDTIGVAADMDTGTLVFFKNGASQGNAFVTGWMSSAGPVRPFVRVNVGGDVFAVNFGQRGFAFAPPSGFQALSARNLAGIAPLLSGSFVGNASADGPFVWTGHAPATLTINGNAVTWGTHADRLAGGFKLRSSSASYNASGTNNWAATLGVPFVDASRIANNAQLN